MLRLATVDQYERLISGLQGKVFQAATHKQANYALQTVLEHCVPSVLGFVFDDTGYATPVQ